MTELSRYPHVLLLPGNMCDARLWTGGGGIIGQAIEALGYNVDSVNFSDDATIEVMATRALDMYEGTVIPLGFSMGGIVALEMCRQAPTRIAALGLIDTTYKPDTRGTERLRQQEDVRQGQLEHVVTHELKPNYLAKCHAENGELLALLCDMAMTLGPEIFIAQSEALRTREDQTLTITGLEMPVFLACGAEDALCPPDLHRAMAGKITQAHLHIIQDAGHILPLEQPLILTNLLAHFLTSTLGNKP